MRWSRRSTGQRGCGRMPGRGCPGFSHLGHRRQSHRGREDPGRAREPARAAVSPDHEGSATHGRTAVQKCARELCIAGA
eukprot:352712-Chlamydomonas_euryale.AAC.9